MRSGRRLAGVVGLVLAAACTRGGDGGAAGPGAVAEQASGGSPEGAPAGTGPAPRGAADLSGGSPLVAAPAAVAIAGAVAAQPSAVAAAAQPSADATVPAVAAAVPAAAPEGKAWTRRIAYTSVVDGATYLFGVGTVRGVRDRALARQVAEQRARVALGRELEAQRGAGGDGGAASKPATLERTIAGAEAIDSAEDDDGTVHVLVRLPLP